MIYFGATDQHCISPYNMQARLSVLDDTSIVITTCMHHMHDQVLLQMGEI